MGNGPAQRSAIGKAVEICDGRVRVTGLDPRAIVGAGRIRYRLSDIEAYEQAGFVSREPAGTTSLGDPSDVRETVARLIRSLGS